LLRKRNDDTKKAIEIRLNDYDKITKKVINRYKLQGKLIEINGNQPIEKVYSEIKTKLKAQKI
jgi:adenylate kinase